MCRRLSLDYQTEQIASVTGAERLELCDKPAPKVVEILSVTNVALSLCRVCNCQPRKKKKVKQLRAAFYPTNHPMNLHAPLLNCNRVRSAGLYCNVNPDGPGRTRTSPASLVVASSFWDEGKAVQEI